MVERNVGMVCLYKLVARAKYEQPKLAKSSHETEGRRFPGEKPEAKSKRRRLKELSSHLANRSSGKK